MRRAAVAAVLAMLAVAAPGVGTAARGEPGPGREVALEAAARASVMSAVLDVQPAFDPAIADSRSASSTIGTSSLQSVVWPSFLVDAFFFLYRFQPVERLVLGIAEARWPQGPTRQDATLSDLLFANGGDPDAIPGRGGRAVAEAAEDHASGEVRLGRVTLQGGTAHKAASGSRVRTAGGLADARAEQALTDVRFGPLEIASIRGIASARAGSAGPAAASRLDVAAATVAGVPVVIDEERARAATGALQRQVDAALRNAGIGVRLMPHSRDVRPDAASAESGGILVEVAQAATDPSGTPRNARIAYLLGSARADARAQSVSGTAGGAGSGAGTSIGTALSARKVFVPATTPGLEPEVAGRGVAAGSPGLLVRRTVVTEPAGGHPGSARGAYLAVMVLALGLLLIRPLVRTASRT